MTLLTICTDSPNLAHSGIKWGLVTELAHWHGVSRTLLYELRDRALQAIGEALSLHQAGRPTQTTTLEVDKALVDCTIAALSLLKGSVRDIRLGLALILDVTRSVGHISDTLTTAGERAADYHLQFSIARCDQWAWLLREVRLVLEPITPTRRLATVAQAQATVEAAIALFRELNHPDITVFANALQGSCPSCSHPWSGRNNN